MEETKRYTIAYRGLRSGLHDFHFKVDGGLFRAFGSTEIKDNVARFVYKMYPSLGYCG